MAVKEAAESKRKEAESKEKEAELKKQQLELAMEDVESKQREAELKKQELETTVEQAALKKAEAEFKAKEAESKNAEAELKTLEVLNWEKRPTPLAVPDGVDVPAMQMQAQALESEVRELKTEVRILESKSELLESASKTLESESQLLQSETKVLQNNSQVLKSETVELEGASQQLKMESQPLVEEASELLGELAAMGYFEPVDDRNLVITLPRNRTWTLPTGIHAVTGEFKEDAAVDGAITFGTITLSDPASIHVAPITTAIAIPSQVPAEGITVTVAGLNLDRIKSAYWNSNLAPVDIIGQGKEKLVLRIKTAPPNGTKEILISDSLPPGFSSSSLDYSRSIVGSVPVTVQERALALASAAESVKPGTATLTLSGFFPAGTTASLGADSTPVKLEITADGSKATVTLGAIFDVLVLGKPSAKIPLVFKSGKDSATVSLNYVNAKVSVVGIYPTVLPAASIPKEMNIVARFDPAYNGDAMVLVGGLSLGVHKVDASGTISIKDLSTRITPDQLEALEKKADLVLLIGNEPFNLEKVISIVPRPKS
ncbi:hypothetical protein OJ996_23060 [Luteolibacter sp. GHJ8]|uniref:IPT/TIG domain-containing protein n=1 Tax=Luteolibacter rhizosphaerae TaxID=2989719 RepID=A0ABT3GAE4_9BACT|nr:hypothetical protein [Luteolibacter rhizosphaerae]MCW1916486.1 hypothetical protein [Luteolibacter rhizosphaerae]